MSLYTIGRKDDKISPLMQINKELLEEDDFKDVTLVSDDLHVVKAHKALLSKSSDVFRQMLMLKDDKDPIIFIRHRKRPVHINPYHAMLTKPNAVSESQAGQRSYS